MRRLIMLVTVVLLMAAMLMFAGPASAQAGCQGFGQFVATGAPHSDVAMVPPTNVDDLVFSLKEANC